MRCLIFSKSFEALLSVQAKWTVPPSYVVRYLVWIWKQNIKNNDTKFSIFFFKFQLQNSNRLPNYKMQNTNIESFRYLLNSFYTMRALCLYRILDFTCGLMMLTISFTRTRTHTHRQNARMQLVENTTNPVLTVRCVARRTDCGLATPLARDSI